MVHAVIVLLNMHVLYINILEFKEKICIAICDREHTNSKSAPNSNAWCMHLFLDSHTQ